MSEHKTFEQIFAENCNGCACTGTDPELYKCANHAFRIWLQQKRKEIVEKYESGNTALRFSRVRTDKPLKYRDKQTSSINKW